MVASDVGLAISDDDLSQLHPSQRCVDLWIVEKFLWGFSKVKPPEQRHMLGCRHKSFHHMDGAALAHSCRSSTEIRRSSSVEEPVANAMSEQRAISMTAPTLALALQTVTRRGDSKIDSMRNIRDKHGGGNCAKRMAAKSPFASVGLYTQLEFASDGQLDWPNPLEARQKEIGFLLGKGKSCSTAFPKPRKGDIRRRVSAALDAAFLQQRRVGVEHPFCLRCCGLRRAAPCSEEAPLSRRGWWSPPPLENRGRTLFQQESFVEKVLFQSLLQL
eukprot:CAMPEP_0180415770 /NCGR_PEP_ID=MMETSP1036_2-20121128/108_1 /TAXON_ID=632150 /ORGANISM="Azadinium spinosum, Strain 3D9" /LENGTH=272 /DNA_ID=CAMNT_0022420617 /DNA_START=971 /DNA_END=1791 /DNA_ORIENTATION=+